jgi:Protein of unknown function (DUF1810)
MSLKFLFVGAILSACFIACNLESIESTKPALSHRPLESRTPALSSSTVPEYSETAQILINKQDANFPNILKELQDNKKKTSHWIWWVFPSEKPGDSEPGQKTSVNLNNVDYLLTHANMNGWSQILEEIFNLLKTQAVEPWKESGNTPNPAVIPSMDHGRIHHALIFWLQKAQDKTKKYPRFFNALNNLNKFNWRS